MRLFNLHSALFKPNKAVIANHEDDCQLTIGRTGSGPLLLKSPSILCNFGCNGYGRRTFLSELARQAIQNKWGLVYVDTSSDEDTWRTIHQAAQKYHRESQCYLRNATSDNPFILGKHIRDVALHGDIIYQIVPTFQEKYQGEARQRMHDFLTELVAGVQARWELPSMKAPPLIVIFDNVLSLMHGLPDALHALFHGYKLFNTSMIFSEQAVQPLPSLLKQHTQYYVYQRIDAEYSSLQKWKTTGRMFGGNASLADGLFNLMPGEAVIGQKQSLQTKTVWSHAWLAAQNRMVEISTLPYLQSCNEPTPFLLDR